MNGLDPSRRLWKCYNHYIDGYISMMVEISKGLVSDGWWGNLNTVCRWGATYEISPISGTLEPVLFYYDYARIPHLGTGSNEPNRHARPLLPGHDRRRGMGGSPGQVNWVGYFTYDVLDWTLVCTKLPGILDSISTVRVWYKGGILDPDFVA
jgi:hypothetical protein